MRYSEKRKKEKIDEREFDHPDVRDRNANAKASCRDLLGALNGRVSCSGMDISYQGE
jgi:hypothetical protein